MKRPLLVSSKLINNVCWLSWTVLYNVSESGLVLCLVTSGAGAASRHMDTTGKTEAQSLTSNLPTGSKTLQKPRTSYTLDPTTAIFLLYWPSFLKEGTGTHPNMFRLLNFSMELFKWNTTNLTISYKYYWWLYENGSPRALQVHLISHVMQFMWTPDESCCSGNVLFTIIWLSFVF